MWLRAVRQGQTVCVEIRVKMTCRVSSYLLLAYLYSRIPIRLHPVLSPHWVTTNMLVQRLMYQHSVPRTAGGSGADLTELIDTKGWRSAKVQDLATARGTYPLI